jgi:hypothetical protein
VNRYVQMAAPDAFTDNLANTRFEWFETFGHAQMQVEETVIHAANRYAQAPAIFRGA